MNYRARIWQLSFWSFGENRRIFRAVGWMLNLKQARDVSRSDANDVSLDREPAVVLTVAEQLRFSRERAERTLDEVAGFLKIRKVHLEALEDGRNDELPGYT